MLRSQHRVYDDSGEVARTQDVWGAEGISGRVKFLPLAWAGMPKTSFRKNSDSPLQLRGNHPELSFSVLSFANLWILFCSFKIPWNSVELIFSSSNLANIKTRFCFCLISTMSFEKATSYFFTSNPAFSQTYVLRVRALFSPAETSFITLSFRSFHNKFLFSYMPSQKAITPKSDAVGRCSMNFGKALSFDIKMTYGKKLRCQRSAGFFC